MSGFTEPAKKHLGQNFLHDTRVIDNIVLAIAPQPGDVIVEIGPGQGALTFPLLKKHGEVTAIEFDRDLHAPLQAAARAHGNLHLIAGDVLGVDFSALAAPVSYTHLDVYKRQGQTSAPFKTDAGWVIVQRVGTRAIAAGDENMRAQVRETIGRRKLEEELSLIHI